MDNHTDPHTGCVVHQELISITYRSEKDHNKILEIIIEMFLKCDKMYV